MNTPEKPLPLDEWEAIEKAATEGPWTHEFERDAEWVDGRWQDTESLGIDAGDIGLFWGLDATEADGKFVAMSREAVRALIARVRELELTVLTQKTIANGARDYIAELIAKPQWHKFDKDDSSTWPPERTPCWFAFENKSGFFLNVYWSQMTSNWDGATHWMPLEVPAPPESGE